MSGESGLRLSIPPEELRPIITEAVEATVVKLEEARNSLSEKIGFSEPEAARLLGLEPHVLRDERRRGRITGSCIVGRRIRYLKSDLVGYMISRRYKPTEAAV